MIGIRVDRRARARGGPPRRAGRGRLRRDHRRHVRHPRRGGLRERRAPAGDPLGEDPQPRRGRGPRRRSCTSSCASRPTRGACAERRPPALPLWSGDAAAALDARPPLPGDLDVDVAVVGAGLTGLWTAHYLAEAQPDLRIAVLEAEVGGLRCLGAQRRLVLGAVPGLARHPGGRVRSRGGAGPAPRDARHRRRGRAGGGRRGHRRPGRQGRHDHAGPQRAAVAPGPGRGRGRPALGARRGRAAAARRRRRRPACWTAPAPAARRTRRTAPPCTPAGWCVGWPPPSSVAGCGSTSTPPSRRSGRGGSARRTARCAPTCVVRATEGWTSTLPGHARTSVPVYSLVIATEPLSEAVWDEIGLRTVRRSATTGT